MQEITIEDILVELKRNPYQIFQFESEDNLYQISFDKKSLLLKKSI